MYDNTPYLLLAIIAIVAVSLLISFWVIKAAVRSANKPIERYLKILSALKSAEADKSVYNATMLKIEMDELERKKSRLNITDYWRKQKEIVEQYK